MPTLEFIAVLSNADDSILGMEFKHGFEATSLTTEEYYERYGVAEPATGGLSGWLSLKHYNALHHTSKRIRFLRTTRPINAEDVNRNNNGAPDAPYSQGMKVRLYTSVYLLGLKLLLDKFRLFTEGDIAITAYRTFIQLDELRYPAMSVWHSPPTLHHGNTHDGTYRVDDVKALSEFVKSFQVPFKYPYLELAHAAFRESYIAGTTTLMFLSLMNALEALFNVERHEVTFQISRGVAVLLGTTPDESVDLAKGVKRLYGIRSDIVHRGVSNPDELERVYELRQLVRRSIRRISELDLDKIDLQRELMRLGYGQGTVLAARLLRPG